MHFLSKRLIRLIPVFMLFVLMQASSAQPPTPGTVPPEQPTDQWVIQVASRNEAAAIAARTGMTLVGGVPNMQGYFILQASPGRGRNAIEARALTNNLASTGGVQFAEQVMMRKYVPRQSAPPYTTSNPPPHATDIDEGINVAGAWAAGYTGKGIRISIVDDGVRHTHPDLIDNYIAADSYDYIDNDTDPFGYTSGHGTAVAGVAVGADNDICSVGVAYDAGFLGVRVVDWDGFISSYISDLQVAAALSHGLLSDKVDIVNASWGMSFEGSGWANFTSTLITRAIQRASTIGRGGKGIIYVWAGGFAAPDHNGADPFLNSPFTIGVATISYDGVWPLFGEQGSNVLVTAPGQGVYLEGDFGVLTANRSYNPSDPSGLAGLCMGYFEGTSASAAMVSGVVALMLEANPNLTWRDVQAILIETAEQNGNTHPDWQTVWTVNGAGYPFSNYYGFGRVDAAAATSLAESWTNLPPAVSYTSSPVQVQGGIPNGAGAISSSVYVPADIKVEHVEVVVNLAHDKSGDLELTLTSPDGTQSFLLQPHDSWNTDLNIPNYSFLSMMQWGEMSKGNWTLTVRDTVTNQYYGALQNWTLHINNPYRTPLKNNHLRADSNRDGLPDDWIAINRTPKQDRIITNNWFDSSIYQLRGTGSNKSSRIEQTVHETINAGTTLEFGAYASGAGQYNGGGVIRLTLNYRDGTSELRVLRLPDTPFAWGYYAQQYKLPKAISNYKLSLGYIRSPANGFMRYDQPFVRAIAMAESGTGTGGLSLPTLPMPDAP